MTTTHTPPVELSVPHAEDSSVTPVPAGNDPVSACADSVEGRIAEEMVATLQDWLHQASVRPVARRRSDDPK